MAGDSRRRTAAHKAAVAVALRPTPHVDASFQFLGASARRVRRRSGTTLDHLDLVHEGWLAFQEAQAKGRPTAKCYMFAENRMATCVEREVRDGFGAVPDYSPSVRRMTPADWRTLHTWLRRVLHRAPQQLRTMALLYQGRSIDEVGRELGVSRNRAYELRAAAIAQLSQATAGVVVPP
jgi:DNA-directed RNA polymerase specialized sigma24 family protein